jgi:hypothetical protein
VELLEKCFKKRMAVYGKMAKTGELRLEDGGLFILDR